MGSDRPILGELRDVQPSRSLIVSNSSLSVLASSGCDSAIFAQRDRGKKIKGWICETKGISGTPMSSR
jgi:hypothetical protein